MGKLNRWDKKIISFINELDLPEYNLTTVTSKKLCATSIEGAVGHGKSTLLKATFLVLKNPTLVFVPLKSIMKEWRGWNVKRAYKTLNWKRFNHYLQRMSSNSVFMEDLPLWAKTDRDVDNLGRIFGNLFSGARKEGRRYTIFSTTPQMQAYPIQALWSFTYYVFIYGGTWNLQRLSARGIPMKVCARLNTLYSKLRPQEHKYFVLDTYLQQITKPVDTRNPKPLLDCICEIPMTKEEAWSYEEFVEHFKTKKTYKRKYPKYNYTSQGRKRGFVSPIGKRVLSAYKNNPNFDRTALANELRVAPRTIWNWVTKIKGGAKPREEVT